MRIKNIYVVYEINKRKKISIFDYKRLSKPLAFFPTSLMKNNCVYGHARIFSKVLENINFNQCFIEHGLYFGPYISEYEDIARLTTIITFSDYRKNILKGQLNKNVITVGPYIQYTDNLLNNDMIKKTKMQLNKTLLYFPSHSIKGVDKIYDHNIILNEIEEIKSKYRFDTILVCMYFNDILKNIDNLYIKYNYKIVTAGHFYDYNFLSRLKSIIELADMTISNDVGTHTGYCIILNKPHYIIEQKKEIKLSKDNKDTWFFDSKNDEYWTLHYKAKQEVCNAFSTYSSTITQHQRDIVEKYWGKIYVKS
jgi:hypothetical protein